MKSAVPKIWLSEKEAIVYSSLSRETLRVAREQSQITYRLFGRKVIYKTSDIDNFIERNTQLYKSTSDHFKSKKIKA